MTEIEKLKDEIKLLKQKLLIAETWMQKSVKEEVKKISKKKINKMTSWVKESFMQENIEDIITSQISNFFWEFILMNTPVWVVDNIISWEINYYNLKQNPSFDWFSVISSYHKAIDVIIESVIIKWFRKFSKKQNQIILRKNDPLEKTLHMVVNKNYILSIGRLFHILLIIKNNESLYDYWKTFKNYLDKYTYLKDILLDDKFLKIFEEVVDSEIFWKKRHTWNISFVETRKARELLIWDFKNKDCLIYMLLKSQEVDY